MDLDNIQKPFIWRKKYEEQGIEIDEKKIEEESRRRAEANRAELAKIRERQQRRELEYQQKLSDNELLQRQKEAEQHEHWEQQEDDFILRQRRQKSKIRIRDGRAKPIDLFAHYIDIFGVKKDNLGNIKGYVQEEKIDLSDSPVELLNPSDWFNGLRLSDLQDLEPEILDYMNTDLEENRYYWQDLLDITKNEISKLQVAKKQASGTDINPAVLDDVKSMIVGKSLEELDEMEKEMEDILCDDDPTVDEGFYRGVLMRLRAHRAKMRLTLAHKENLKRQKDHILDDKKDVSIRIEKDRVKTESNNEGNLARLTLDGNSENRTKDDAVSSGIKHGNEAGSDNEDVNQDKNGDDNDHDYDEIVNDEDETGQNSAEQIDKFEETRRKCIEDYNRNCYSPEMLTKDQLEPGIVPKNYEEEFKLLKYHRNKVCNASSLDELNLSGMSREEKEFMNAASTGMTAEEVTFSCEAPVRGPDNRNQTYIWADKYQPRKPRYFNRVHTGFEWNKYNQTHYDVDNPPPKVVQGYKFNIFYPDLIDKSKAPRFYITPCKDDKDFCIIRFSAGPPYEDIAFKIVNREWNNTHKSGYRCQFMNNMLQLWFHFKRYKYRR
jgi:hypothetical protein